MPRFFLFRFLLISGLLTLNLTVEAYTSDIDDLNWAKPGQNVEAGQIYIQVLNEAAPLTITVYDGIVMTGIPTKTNSSIIFTENCAHCTKKWAPENPSKFK